MVKIIIYNKQFINYDIFQEILIKFKRIVRNKNLNIQMLWQ